LCVNEEKIQDVDLNVGAPEITIMEEVCAAQEIRKT